MLAGAPQNRGKIVLQMQDFSSGEPHGTIEQGNYSGEAEKIGLKMPPTKLLIFGNPAAGTPLMLAAPGSAIDLPLKILVWQDIQGKVWVSYNSPEYLMERHGLPQGLLPNIAVVKTLATKAGE
jgi:uncharacterized protein (DUF302 family)